MKQSEKTMKQRSNQLKIPQNLTRFLAGFLSEDLGELYPFARAESAGKNEVMALKKSDIIDDKEELQADLKKSLLILSEASALTRVRFMSEGDWLEYNLYFTGSGLQASLGFSEKHVEIDSCPDIEAFLHFLNSFSGTSVMTTVEADWSLTIEESYTIALFLDIIRRRMLTEIANDRAFANTAVSFEDILAENSREKLSGNSFVFIIRAISPDASKESITTLYAETLDSLCGKKILEKKGSGYIGGEALLCLARRLLLINMFFLVDHIRVEQKPAIRQRYAAIQNGLRDFLMFDVSEEKIIWKGISSSLFTTILCEHLFYQPSPLQKQARASSVVAYTCNVCAEQYEEPGNCPVCNEPLMEDESLQTCPDCNNQIAPGAEICQNCGKHFSISVKSPDNCRKCGHALKPGKKFCSHCGQTRG